MRLTHLTAGLGVFALLAIAAPPAIAQEATTNNISEHEWVVTGFVGPTFGEDVDEADTGVGGALTYLYNGWIGGEFLAGFTPSLNIVPEEVLGAPARSSIGHYQVNGVVAVPLGEDGRWQPFVSGGVGPMTMGELETTTDDIDLSVDDVQLAGNVGLGLMGFGEQWGFRSSLRYVTGLSSDSAIVDETDLLDPTDVLSDLSFWRFNAGVAYRW